MLAIARIELISTYIQLILAEAVENQIILA